MGRSDRPTRPALSRLRLNPSIEGASDWERRKPPDYLSTPISVTLVYIIYLIGLYGGILSAGLFLLLAPPAASSGTEPLPPKTLLPGAAGQLADLLPLRRSSTALRRARSPDSLGEPLRRQVVVFGQAQADDASAARQRVDQPVTNPRDQVL